MLTVTNNWKKTYPGAHCGILVMNNVSNPLQHAGLDRVKREIEADLRALFKDRSELKLLEPIRAYQSYYKEFNKTYHVLQQLESVIFKGKPIPTVSALVESMFIEELRNLLLTAGHDLDSVEAPVTLDVAKGDEDYTLINGRDQIVKPRDMILKDLKGVISSVLYGPDQRTRITPSTSNVLFVVYAVPGISEKMVTQHLQGIEANVKIIAPQAFTYILKVYGTD
ncbi:MAG: phenylalanine--tRNA ligase beta subunit-related protein [Deltaproteobacteria bacterium]|nr:phenylalanine--tRNA ligase beta subunit-related protein [Deltaproteobacteria bacterium]